MQTPKNPVSDPTVAYTGTCFFVVVVVVFFCFFTSDSIPFICRRFQKDHSMYMFSNLWWLIHFAKTNSAKYIILMVVFLSIAFRMINIIIRLCYKRIQNLVLLKKNWHSDIYVWWKWFNSYIDLQMINLSEIIKILFFSRLANYIEHGGFL